MDYRAVNLQKKKDDNALRNYALRSDTIKPSIQDDLKQPVSLEKSGATDNNAMRNSYAMSKTVNCVHCSQPFERRTTWHKYCSELCKIKAYEVRTGKKWKARASG